MAYPTLDSVSAFAEVAEQRSFVKASKRLGVAASTLSRRIAALELSSGLRLLERTTRQVRLTEAGQVYFEQCQAIVRELKEASRVLEELSQHPHGRLVVSVSTALAGRPFAKAVARFIADHPGVSVSVRVEDRRVDLMREGVDVAVRGGQRLDDSSHLHARKLGEVVPLLCAAPAYLAKHGRPRNPADLRQHNLIGIYRDSISRTTVAWPLIYRQRAINFTAPARVVIGSFETLREVLLEGAGISLLPPAFSAELVSQGKLACVSPDLSSQSYRVVALTLGRTRLPTKVKRFVDILVDESSVTLPKAR